MYVHNCSNLFLQNCGYENDMLEAVWVLQPEKEGVQGRNMSVSGAF